MAYGLTQSMRLTKASSQYATAADSASLSPTGNITIEFWVKMKETLGSGSYRNMIIKSTLGASNRSYEIIYGNVGGTPTLFFYIFAGGTPTNFFEGKISKTLTADTWVHVALICTTANAAATKVEWVFDGTSAGNGTGANTGSGCTAIYDSTVPFRIGQADPVTTGYYVDAQFSLVRLWDVARTASQVSTNMCSVLGSTSNLKGEWTLDNVYTDNSGNGNTLSGVNTPTFVTDTPSTCAAAGATINPSAQVTTSSIPAYSIIRGAVLPAAAQVVTASIPAYAITGAALVSVNAKVATFSIPTYTIQAAGVMLSPAVQALTFTVPTYSVLAAVSLSVEVQSLTVSLPAGTVTGGGLVSVSPIVLTFSLPTLAFVGAIWGRTARATTGADWTRSAVNNDA